MKVEKYSEQVKIINPILHPVHACVRVPGSKSQTNRALLVAALADGTSALSNALFSDDSLYFANALETLGLHIILDEEKTCMLVHGSGGTIPRQNADIFIGNAGTAARFLTAFLTLGNGTYTLDGNARMRERPIGDLVQALNGLGANVKVVNHGQANICPPLRITSSGLPGGKTKVSGDISSQFLSALLLVAPYADSAIEIEVTTELNSKPYIDMTLSVMADFGIAVPHTGYRRFMVNPSRYTSLSNYVIESDASAAAYFFAVPAICKGSVRVTNISRKSIQGDVRFLNVLSQMGLHVRELEDGIEVSSPLELKGVEVDMRDIPDTAQTLAVIAPFASTPTRIRGIASMRIKETDRIFATCSELQRIGVRVDEFDDGMTIYPTANFNDSTVHTYNDHRMAMAFSLIGLRVPGIRIENPACVSKTFPDYFDELDKLR